MKKHLNDTLILWSQGITIIVLLIIMLAMSSCTVVTAHYGEFSLTVASLQPSGRTTEATAEIEGVGTLTIGSTTEDNSAVVGAVVDAAVGL